MRTLIVSLALLACGDCLADEILMKDGKRIAWKSVSEEGDSYVVTTKDGSTVKVKKTEVEKFVVPSEPKDATPAAGPLTGATFTFGQRKTATVNLLPKAITDHASPADSWKTVGMAITGEAVFPAWATLPFDYDVPADDYDLTLTVERLSGVKTFAVGVGTPQGGCGYHFDAYDGTLSCLTVLAGQEGEHAKGAVLKKGQPKVLKLSVRKDALQISVDGKEFWKGRVPWSAAVIHSNIQLRDKGKLFLAMEGGSFKIHAFTVTIATAAK
jgi:hypothetical protein